MDATPLHLRRQASGFTCPACSAELQTSLAHELTHVRCECGHDFHLQRPASASTSPATVGPQPSVPGLSFGTVDDGLVATALSEANAIFTCCTQIASNQKFFLNLPFPLSGEREAGTPVLPWGDSRVAAIEQVVRSVAAQFAIPDKLERANVIAREYRPGQKIGFHVDDELCGPRVFGVVLLNKKPECGLVLTKGGVKHVIREEPGTAFLLEEQARYAWKHGLPPAPARRVSLTVRFFRRDVVLPEPIGEHSALMSAADVPVTSAAVTIVRNNKQSVRKAAVLASPVQFEELLRVVRNKLNAKPIAIFHEGMQLQGGERLPTGAFLFVLTSASEAYAGPPPPEPAAPSEPAARGWDAVLAERRLWEAWRYPRLAFTTLLGEPGTAPPAASVIAADVDVLSAMLAGAQLSVPELRELVQHVQVDVPPEAVRWRFYSGLWGPDTHAEVEPRSAAAAQWAEGRLTAVVIEDAACGRGWVEFRVEGMRALRGAKKRDGPLWLLDGGLNNGMRPAATKTTSDLSAESAAALSRSHGGQGGGSKLAGANGYQRKRGVLFTQKFLLFGGTVWPSTYYPCELLLDGHRYSSAAQFVMAEQARIFGDAARLQELLDANHAPAPHKLFDHKAPKTGERRLVGYDAAVWEQHRDRVMWRATLEKFRQNAHLRYKLLQLGSRQVVEATDDPFWGSGVVFGADGADDPQRWTGLNQMGKLLTAVALRIRAEASDEEMLLSCSKSCDTADSGEEGEQADDVVPVE